MDVNNGGHLLSGKENIYVSLSNDTEVNCPGQTPNTTRHHKAIYFREKLALVLGIMQYSIQVRFVQFSYILLSEQAMSSEI